MEESQRFRQSHRTVENGTTHLARKAEHAVDVKTEMIMAAEIYPGNVGDRQTLEDTVNKAQVNLQQAQCDVDVKDVVPGKGYYSAAVVETFAEQTPHRRYMPEPRLPVC
jgi:hypothetical protein